MAADATAAPAAIEAQGLDVAYGVIRAVQEVTLAAPKGEITALVGSNGAGKSSILRSMAGLVQARSGRIVAAGADITKVSTKDRVIEHGIVLVPEGRSAFTTMTVLENLAVGERVGRIRAAAGVAATFSVEEAFELFPVLRERKDNRAQYLSGGEQQMLALARSLLMSPSVLLVDEPSMGLAPLLVRKIFGVMTEVFRRHSVSVLLVEQDTAIALELSSSAYLLEQGRIVAHAPSRVLRDDPRLRAAYLGHADALGVPVAPATPDSTEPLDAQEGA